MVMVRAVADRLADPRPCHRRRREDWGCYDASSSSSSIKPRVTKEEGLLLQEQCMLFIGKVIVHEKAVPFQKKNLRRCLDVFEV